MLQAINPAVDAVVESPAPTQVDPERAKADEILKRVVGIQKDGPENPDVLKQQELKEAAQKLNVAQQVADERARRILAEFLEAHGILLEPSAVLSPAGGIEFRINVRSRNL